MTSNMFAGERRQEKFRTDAYSPKKWRNARRGGMTVLGKVSVPKPLNLPSQRLENHKSDPSVDIVPKTTLGWGSRPSSSGLKAWISSSMAPNADGGNTSTNHLSGRPPSGESVARPLTAGSDTTHKPITSSWGSNSRPSSASGTLACQSSLTSLRPRSAETRPNSSQHSRLALPVSESPLAWGPRSAAESLGVKLSNKDGFSLSSGDFPTLGSEKDNTVKNLESQDHSRPSSAFESMSPSKEDATHHVGLGGDPNCGPVNSWRKDGPPVEEDGVHPGMEKRLGDPQEYINAHIGPRHLDDTRRGHPVNVPGVWYGGQPRNPAFGPPGAPGGFPMVPYPYHHRPQIPPSSLAGSQPIPAPGGGPRGPHPNNAESYRPHMPNSYVRPGMPYRPGYYPGPKQVPVKNRNEDQMDEIEDRENSIQPDASHPEKGCIPAPATRNYERGADGDAERDISPRKKTQTEDSAHSLSYRDHYSDSIEGKSLGGMQNVNVDDGWTNKSVGMTTFSPHMPQLSVSSKRELPLPPTTKGPVLMHRSEGLNEEVCASDGWNETPNSHHKEEQKCMSKVDQKSNISSGEVGVNGGVVPKGVDDLGGEKQIQSTVVLPRRQYHGGQGKMDHRGKGKCDDHDTDGWRRKSHTPEIISAATSSSMTSVSGPSFVKEGAEFSSVSSVLRVERESYDSTDIQAERVKRRELAKQRALQLQKEEEERIREQRARALVKLEELNNRTKTSESPPVTTDIKGEAEESSVAGAAVMLQPQSQPPSRNLISGSGSDEIVREKAINSGGESANLLAKQCAFQLQKEEDGHIQEQRAMALIKLEELNKQTQTGESASITSDIQGEAEESHVAGMLHPQSQPLSRNLISESGSDIFDRENVNIGGKSGDMSPSAPHTGVLESNVSQVHTLSVDGNTQSEGKNASLQSSDGGTSVHKRTGYKQEQNSELRKYLSEMSEPNFASEAHKNSTGVTAAENTSLVAHSSALTQITESNVHGTSNNVTESSASQKKIVNMSDKNNHRVDEPVSQPVISELNMGSKPVQESKVSLSNLEGPVSTFNKPNGTQALEAHSALQTEEPQSRPNNNWKPRLPRRMPRSQHANRFTEKVHNSGVVWAPVRTQNKAGESIVTSPKMLESEKVTKRDSVAHNSYIGKRAEIERHVPKPVAKELAPASAPLLSSSADSPFRLDEVHWTIQFGSINAESARHVSSTNAFTGSSSEVKEGDARHTKPKTDNGHWKKRGTVHSPVSESTKDTKSSLEQIQSVNGYKNLSNAFISIPGTVDAVNYNPNTVKVSILSSVKDQGAINHGKRHMPVSRRDGNDTNYECISSIETDKIPIRLAAPDVNHNDRTLHTIEQQSMGECSSQWKPKSYPNSTNNQQIDKSGRSQTVITQTNKPSKENHFAPGKVVIPPQHDNINQPQRDQPIFSSNVADGSITGSFGSNHTAAKGRSSFLNEDPIVSADSAPGCHHLDWIIDLLAE